MYNIAMQLRLKILSGPAEGQSVGLREGLTIGRQDAGLNLADPRVSSVHARVVRRGSEWHLVDNHSKNGIRDTDGNKIETVLLEAGARFAIGESQFEVEGAAVQPPPPGASPRPASPKAAAAEDAPPETRAPKTDKPAKNVRVERKNAVRWHEALANFVQTEAPRFRDQIRPTALFQPAVVFEFARGSQVNARWILGYGPRQIGGATIDLPLWEPDIPPICFELTPTSEGVLLTTLVRDLVRVNGRGVDKHVLTVGDRIEIRETLIEVDFSE